jgi:hypothetical protein
LLLLLFSGSALAQGFDHSHGAWNALLHKHVVLIGEGRASQVRYAELAKERAVLKAYLDALSGVIEAEFKGWSKPQRMAFLINAYNAFTVELILANYPVKSIKDIGNDLFSNRGRRSQAFGRTPLDQIEHDAARRRLRRAGALRAESPRSAVRCCARRPALPAPGGAAEDQTRRFLSDTRATAAADGRLEVSKIFDWYKEDFAPREKFFARYFPDGRADHLPDYD